ncbi:hypothetical protein [Pseudomonas sp. S1(2024)]|uniref:hypothetical protein n=1 Tax=Pseudomonas sp. S1(2024) TaxID=3390191 RepID=UPI00397AEFAD
MEQTRHVALNDQIEAASATALLLMKSGKYKRLPEMRSALQEDYPQLAEEDIDRAIQRLANHLVRNDFQGIRTLRANSTRRQRDYEAMRKARDEVEVSLASF